MKYRSVYVSDVHLGTKACKAKRLLKFLDSIETEKLFLVGDIVDGWALRRKHYWSKTQTEILRKLLKISEKSEIIYIVGNHDEFIRPFFQFDFQFGRFEIVNEYTYSALDGRNILVTHGDLYDWTMRVPTPLLNLFGHIVDLFSVEKQSTLAQQINQWLSTERVLTKYVSKHQDYDAVICGHTHVPKMTPLYMNTGDWVHNCTYIAEDLKGKWHLKSYEK